jgi:hypothetical protein
VSERATMVAQDSIGRYRLLRRLSAVTFATVWLGHDDDLDVPVAVKVLADNWAKNSDARHRFLAEGRICGGFMIADWFSCTTLSPWMTGGLTLSWITSMVARSMIFAGKGSVRFRRCGSAPMHAAL